MQYTISMTSRMLAIASLCVFLLCVLLFLLGIELGKRFAEPVQVAAPATAAASPTMPGVAVPSTPALPAAPSAPTITPPAVTAPTIKH